MVAGNAQSGNMAELAKLRLGEWLRLQSVQHCLTHDALKTVHLCLLDIFLISQLSSYRHTAPHDKSIL